MLFAEGLCKDTNIFMEKNSYTKSSNISLKVTKCEFKSYKHYLFFLFSSGSGLSFSNPISLLEGKMDIRKKKNCKIK